jgi:DNA polymerase III epsilon subunit-like protein
MTSKKEIFVSVDIESSGPIPGEYSMLSIGACDVYDVDRRFSCLLMPTSDNFVSKAIEVTGLSIQELKRTGKEPRHAMKEFSDWITNLAVHGEHLVFVGFNSPFDWSFVNYYFHLFLGSNPFGFSAIDIKSMYFGATGCDWRDTRSSEISKRVKPKSRGTHDALEDALYQAEIFRLIRDKLM